MAAYVPGEQPAAGTYIKLNTNENPYPPSPRVLEALQAALTGDHLRRYPDSTGRAFRETAGRVHGVDPDAIVIGNGSDDVLTILTRTFVPEGGLVVTMTPSYVLYRTMSQIQGAKYQEVPFAKGWRLPRPWPVRGAKMTIIANPNSPSGTCVDANELAEIEGPLIVDEAYVDFAERNCLQMLSRKDVVVTRTLSKSYGLAGIRFGYGIADPALVREFGKVKDTYNCDVLSLVAAQAALEDQAYMQQTRALIVQTRQRLEAGLSKLGFEVTPSQANFVWCRRADRPLRPILEELKQRRILVRYFDYAGYGDGLRITVGTEQEIGRLLEEVGRL